MSKEYLMQFIREKARPPYSTTQKGNPRGIIIAKPIDGEIHIGWSFTNKKAGDKFSKSKGLLIAQNRLTNAPRNKTLPHAICKVYDDFIARAEKYFKINDFNISA